MDKTGAEAGAEEESGMFTDRDQIEISANYPFDRPRMVRAGRGT